MDAYSSTLIDAIHEDSRIRSIRISSDHPQGYIVNADQLATAHPSKLVVILAPDSIQVDMSLFVSLSEHRLNQLKRDLQNDLIGSQNGNQRNKQRIENAYRNALIQFKRVIRGQVDY